MTDSRPAPADDPRTQRLMGALLGVLALVAAGALLWVWLEDNGFLRGGDGTEIQAQGNDDYDPWAVPAKPKERPEFKDVTTCGDMTTRARVCSVDFDVDAAFEPVSADKKGQLVVPTHSDHPAVGWFDETVPIGSAQGTSLLAGHVDYPWDSPTLAALKTAKPGQKLWVSDGDGAVHTYTASQVREPLPRGALPADVYAADGAAGLSMVTCTGDYVQLGEGTDWSYTHNLIADFTLDPEPSPVP